MSEQQRASAEFVLRHKIHAFREAKFIPEHKSLWSRLWSLFTK